MPTTAKPKLCPNCCTPEKPRYLDNLGRCGSCDYGWSYAMSSFKSVGVKDGDVISIEFTVSDAGVKHFRMSVVKKEAVDD